MKPIIAGILTVLILATMLVLGSRGTVRTAPPGPQTDDVQVEPVADPAELTIQTLLRSGEAGDVSAYLSAFADPIKARLEREIAGRGPEAFADDLKRAAAARKSHAVFAAEADGPDSARVAVETVYPDRNERQTYRVARTADGWRIADVATVRSHQPAAKFGTPAGFIAPEGVPVQTAPKVGVTVETGDDPDMP